jgi:anti-sigma regulatory factor (Ser/Thr protein kinase)
MEIAFAFKMSVTERSAVSEARRQAENVALRLGFNRTEIGSIAIIVTELGQNLAKYSHAGELLVQTLTSQRNAGIEIIALDRGPGMGNPAACVQDGFSTGGTPGTGLGAIQRLSTVFDIFSVPKLGTVVLSRFWAKRSQTDGDEMGWKIGGLNIPKPGLAISGDAYAWKRTNRGLTVLLADGLGHGPLAAEASRAAVDAFRTNAQKAAGDIVATVHNGLRRTRGAAVAVAQIDTLTESVHFAGIGNISGVVMGSGRNQNLVSLSGTVGAEVHKIQEFIYEWRENSALILNSDGISTKWRLDPFVGVLRRHPSIISGVVYRDGWRGTDDSSIVVVRQVDGDCSSDPAD